ncbi:MAG: TetR family transcriptional regulator [Pseudonocardiaceae bacterium]|nr:TetR family transcriptional regulator [Pseudonocardiaceae bacterium]
MGRPPDPARKAELLDAAVDYVFRHGLAGLSLRPLASALETSSRMLVYHFGGKEELISQIVQAVRARFQGMLDELAPRRGDRLAVLDTAWRLMSAPEAAPFFRFFFEVYGLALREPVRYQGFLEHVVADWLRVLGGDAQATALVALVRGLLLDLVSTGDRARVEAAYRWARSSLAANREP